MPPSGKGSKPAGLSNITRRRTGCIPCRDKHVRCDERKPSCRRCERTSADCYWTRDIRIVFHSPETSQTNQPRSRIDTPAGFRSPVFNRQSQHRSIVETPVFLPSSDAPPVDLSALDDNETSSEPGLACIRALEDAEPVVDAEHFTSWSNLEASDLVQRALRTDMEVLLMHNYLTECAPWFDAHSAQLYYSRIEVPRMLKCPPWRAAALALSAKNIELRERRALTPGSESLPLHLYQLAVRLAIESMSGRFEVVGTLAGCVLLCVVCDVSLLRFDSCN